MPQSETLVALLTRLKGMIAKHFFDFSDADMFVRPVPAANHAAWQMSHLLAAHLRTIKAFDPSSELSLPEQFAKSGTKELASSDDATKFLPKTELLALLDAALDKMIAAVKPMKDADFEAPSPEAVRGFAPNLGMLALMIPLHTSTHIGQVQVIRRKLGKPVLF